MHLMMNGFKRGYTEFGLAMVRLKVTLCLITLFVGESSRSTSIIISKVLECDMINDAFGMHYDFEQREM
ncbi:hypothetical protein H5410_044807 [Solanum commersonii]|uniref:Uncharacterized protein n=1 Tax=Solanum commersonii TaxID=4109 RepID=A0A9J5XA02_SOLCO|nr:hypothetical protein H5410_044807 [Solanum commersonii]